MTFTDFVCVFLVGPGRRAADGEDGGRSTRPGALADPAGGGGRRGPVDGGGQAGGDKTAEAPPANTKTLWAGANAPAHSVWSKTPVLTRTQLSSAQLK